jgi:hypothetical protein
MRVADNPGRSGTLHAEATPDGRSAPIYRPEARAKAVIEPVEVKGRWR